MFKLLTTAALVTSLSVLALPFPKEGFNPKRLMQNNSGVTIATTDDTKKAAQEAIDKMARDALSQKVVVGATVPLIFAFENESSWQSLEEGISKADQTVTIDLTVQGVGGVVYLLNEFVNVVKDAQARGVVVNMDITGPAASAHAFMTCYANHVNIRQGASLLFHEPYAEGSALNGLVSWRETMTDPANNALEDSYYDQCVKVGLLNKQDVKDIKSGSDIIIANINGKLTHIVAHDAMDYLSVINQLAWLLAAAAVGLFIVGLVKRV